MTLIIFVFGLVVGSFLNSVIYRLQQKKSFVRGRSACPHCQHQLSWFELLPLVSFIIQRGRCRKCQAKLDWQYPLVEFLTVGGILGFGLLAFSLGVRYLRVVDHNAFKDDKKVVKKTIKVPVPSGD